MNNFPELKELPTDEGIASLKSSIRVLQEEIYELKRLNKELKNAHIALRDKMISAINDH